MLTIWGRPDSSNVQALMWCVGEFGLAWRRHDSGHRFGGLDTEEFGAMNPHRRVPVLRDAVGTTVWETGAILRYLAARYGPESFWPADPAARAQPDMWAEWAKLNVATGFTAPVFWRVVRTAPSQRDHAGLERALAALDAQLDTAEWRLSQSAFLGGPDFGLADIQFGHVLYRYFDIDISRPDRPALRG